MLAKHHARVNGLGQAIFQQGRNPSLINIIANARGRTGLYSGCLAIALAAMPAMAHAQAPAQEVRLPPTAAQPTPAVSSYRINPGDELEIYVWGEERLQRQLKVLPDGTISFPLVGQLQVQGKLPQDVERMVSDRLKSQYRGEVPFVTVSVRAPAGMRFSVLGKVNSPGVYDATRYVNVLEALSQAGGPAEFANLDNLLVIRGSGANVQTIRVHLGRLFKSGATEQDVRNANLIEVAPGDVIIVP
jgi:polysaccharide export outer membrane protein